MITLYQLHWSHYVEKVRWALDYKGVTWTAVDVDPYTKREMRHLGRKTTLPSGSTLYTVPTIHDEATASVIGESSEILAYLERTYPTPALYPEDAAERAQVARWMVWLDSTLGLAARRLAYTQIALEHPGYLAELFLPELVRSGAAETLKARFVGAIMAGVLAQRFRFVHNRTDRVFEQLEECLLFAARRLSAHHYLVGDRFTAADLTLAALLRPVRLVPCFRDDPRFKHLFAWRAKLLQEHRRERPAGYESAMHEIRGRRGWELGAVKWLPESRSTESRELTEVPDLPAARNDQQPVRRFPLITGPIWYVRLVVSCGLGRTDYPR
ncbi:MAG TPA: glutathione S-transferase family protein [Steroidobacteraceae bacterium]|jgi:glutathione S-transferase|nr:glutathione S-transferase family protein [Steroidobacteraceae bacterium]